MLPLPLPHYQLPHTNIHTNTYTNTYTNTNIANTSTNASTNTNTDENDTDRSIDEMGLTSFWLVLVSISEKNNSNWSSK